MTVRELSARLMDLGVGEITTRLEWVDINGVPTPRFTVLCQVAGRGFLVQAPLLADALQDLLNAVARYVRGPGTTKGST